MAMSRQRLELSDKDPLRQDYFLPDAGARLLGAGADGFVAQAISRRSGYSDALKFARQSANDTQREVQALQAIGRHRHVVELREGVCTSWSTSCARPCLSRVARDLGGSCTEGLQEQVSQLPLGW